MTAAPVAIQREGELEELVALYRERCPMHVLEIGTLHGGTLVEWLRHAPVGATVAAIDDQHSRQMDYPRWCPRGVALEVLHGRSQDAGIISRAGTLGPFDWVYIDAGHQEHEVRADWENYSPMVAPGGAVVFHDILKVDTHPHIQVWKLWAELEQTHETRVIGVDTGVVFT